MYYVARWYDPQVGRFLSPDSIVPEPGNPQGLNRFSYVNNNPTRYTDASGHIGPLAVAVVPVVFYLTVSYGPQVYVALTEIAYSAGPIMAAFPTQSAYLMQEAGRFGSAAGDRLREFAREAQRRINQASQGGNTAQPNPSDPWKWNSGNYREGHEEYYGVTRDANYQVHHILRQQPQFEDIMRRAGVNVHDPRWLREVPRVGGANSIHQWFTNQWSAWTRGLGHTPTAQELVAQAQRLEEEALRLWSDAVYRLGGRVDWQALMDEVARYQQLMGGGS